MECRPTAPWRASLWRSSLAVLALALLTSCTTYIIQRPDGTLVRVDHPPDGLDPPDKDGSEPIIIEDEGLVIEVETSTEYVLSDGQQPVHLQVTVRAEEIEVVERAPLDLALVIDRSGSMRGTKLLQAKMAARQLIEHLHHGDRASIVSYAGDVRVDVPATVVDSYSRQQLTDAVDRLLASGQTFLSGGLEAGAAELRTRHQGERLHRVVLLSDGRANVGVVDRARLDRMAGRLYEEGISVTTMGLGVDYDEDLMTAIAVAGGGNYYFIEHPERLADVFERELNVLSTVISRDMILYLELMDGVVVEDVYGYRHEQRGRELRIPLSSVSSGQRRRLLMTLDVPPAAVGRQVIAQGRIDYRHEVQQARIDLRASISEVSIQRPARAPLRERGASVLATSRKLWANWQ